MNDFYYYNPVRLIFGRDKIRELGECCQAYNNILLCYGCGSVKKNGVFDKVLDALSGKTIIEFSDIPSNPTYEHCLQAIDIISSEEIDFILAVGGGSVIDAAKFISLAGKFEHGDPCQIMSGASVSESIPLGCVVTLPASGSEMNCSMVISRTSTKEKIPLNNRLCFPVFSVLDPTTTFSLPVKQTANGIIDTFVHVCEQFITKDINTPLQDYQAMAILKVLLREGPKAILHPDDYDVRANLMWCSTNALNHLINRGTVSDWSIHEIGHELTAFYGLDHAVTLAIIMPRLWEYGMDNKYIKLKLFASEIWGESGDDAVDNSIVKTEHFFNKLGVKTRLSDWGIDSGEASLKISERLIERNSILGENRDISPHVVAEIIRKCH